MLNRGEVYVALSVQNNFASRRYDNRASLNGDGFCGYLLNHEKTK